VYQIFLLPLGYVLMVVYLSQRVLVEYDQSVLLSKQNNLKFRNLMNLKMKDKRQQVLLPSFTKI
jgi:hypothetical protein